MWLLPPDFPADAFDLPPGTWALPWYADEQHIATLMRLLVAGEARIREWAPLPWAALDEVDADGPVRTGAALVLHAPADLSTEDIVSRARALPWPYVFWQSRRPVLEGEGAWLEREVKRALLSELHRGLRDPEHPLARYHVERLPLDMVASMVADPVDLLEVTQAAIMHRLEHAWDGLEREDYEYSVKWATGRRLGDYLSRLPDEARTLAMFIIRRGRRGSEDRAIFRRGALSIQEVGLGVLVGEDLALGPLARYANDGIVWAGAISRTPTSPVTSPSLPTLPRRNDGSLPRTRITLPSVGILEHGRRYRWILDLGYRDGGGPWAHALQGLMGALRRPISTSDFSRLAHQLATSHPTEYQDQRIHELFQLVATIVDPTQDPPSDLQLSAARRSAAALIATIARNDAKSTTLEHIDSLLVEHVLIHKPSRSVLNMLIDETTSRPSNPPSPPTWIDAIWSSIGAEALRRSGRSHAALARFNEASHHWAALDSFDFREEWLLSRMSAACAAFNADQLEQSTRILDLISSEIEQDEHERSYAALSLLRGMIAIRRDAASEAKSALEVAADRYRKQHDVAGEAFATVALHAHAITADTHDALLRTFGAELELIPDNSTLTYANLVLGDITYRKHDLEASREHYRRAKALSAKTGDDLALSTAYHKLANLEVQVNRFKAAVRLERRAFVLEHTIGHSTLYQQTDRTIAEIERLAASRHRPR